jgi:hypothetical protein
MASPDSVDRIPEERRKQIFEALVDAQDHDMGVGPSRKWIADKFGVSESIVRQIEQEGLDNDWPPLGEVEPDDE